MAASARAWVSTAALLLLPGALRALDWSSDRVALVAQPLQTAVEVSFPFTNNTATPVTISEVTTNCDCLAATAIPRTVAPGATGTIRAQFTVGDRLGPYERAILVRSSDRAEPKRLVVQLEVPEPASVSPLNLVWAIGAVPETKIVEVRPAPGTELEFVDAFASSAAFSVRLETIRPQQLYRLHVTPVGTAAAANAAVRAKARTPSGREIIVSAYANVR
jgi:hypothetical protein